MREAGDLQRHHEPDDGTIERRADAGTMRAHDVDLQLGQFVGRDTHACKLAETRIDAIDRVVATRGTRKKAVAAGDAMHRGDGNFQSVAAHHGAP